MGHFVIWTFF